MDKKTARKIVTKCYETNYNCEQIIQAINRIYPNLFRNVLKGLKEVERK